jgi:hypothetical protein
LKSLIAIIIADFLENHNFIFSLAHSIITITVSIAIHKVNTREKFVKKFKLSHNVSSTINVIRKERGNNKDAIIHSLNHTKNIIVIKTKTIVVKAVLERLS